MVPAHVAIIMDGNGRWAKSKNKPRTFGHQQGLKIAEQIIEQSRNLGVKYLSLFVFSTENWKRPQAEVDSLFALAEKYISHFKKFTANKMRVVVSGDKTSLPASLVTKIDKIENETQNCTDFCVNLCINYGGQDDIVHAAQVLSQSGQDINQQSIANNLYNGFLPAVDMMIRTGGQKRLSNFLLYQCAYAELFFVNTLWPDFSVAQYNSLIEEYACRTRNFGGLIDAK